MSPLELVIRATAVYWFLFLVIRVILRRDVGAIGVADVLLVVLIASPRKTRWQASIARSRTARSLSRPSWAGTCRLAFRSSRLRRMLEPRPIPIVCDGRILQANLRRPLMSVEDLLGKLREHGVDDVAQVRTAHLASDGKMSAVKRDDRAPVPRARARTRRASA